jgi:hypothetical protein
MARYFHRTNKTSAAAPSASEIGEGEIAINSSASLGGTDGTPGRLYIKMSNGEIRRFIGLGLTDAFKTKYGGTNNTFSGATSPADSSADSLMRFQHSSVGNHTINNINSGKLTWNDSSGRLNINRVGTAAQATLHVGGNVRIDTINNWSGSSFGSTFALMGRSTIDNEVYGIPSQNFVSYIADGGISSNKLGIVALNKGGLGASLSPNDGDTLYYSTTSTAFSTTSNLKWDNSNNRLGVNTSSPGTTLHVNGVIRASLQSGTGTQVSIDFNGDLIQETSSRRFKENIVDYTKGLSTLTSLNPVTYKYIGQDKINAGLIAEDLVDLGLEEFVIRDEENLPKSISYSHMVSLLINAIKDLKVEVDQLKQQING